MTGLPWFRFYPRDWFLDTRDLSDRAKGCYIDLLAAMYGRGGGLPYDEKNLARLCGYGNVRSLRTVLDELIQAGKVRILETANGPVVMNGRTMEEIGKANARTEDGKTGGRPKSAQNERKMGEKWAKNEAENAPGLFENQGHGKNPPEARSQIPESKKETDQEFEEWWKLVPLKKSKGQARRAFRSALNRVDLKTLRDGMIRYAAEVKGREPRFIKHPSTWLNGDCWLDETAPAKASVPDPEVAQRRAREATFRKTGLWDTAWGLRPDEAPGEAEPIRREATDA